MVPVFYADDYLSRQQQGICTYMADISTVEHRHNYYELFLVDAGHAKHFINSAVLDVTPGTLCLIRPDDVHYLSPGRCNIYNVLIRSEIWELLCGFLGSNELLDELLGVPMPLHLQLNHQDFESMRRLLENNILRPHTSVNEFNTHLKAVAVSMLEKFFEYPVSQPGNAHPAWFDSLLSEMQQPQNYVEGLEAMYRISGYSPEYLCRIFKKELGVTPTEFINTVRVRAASKHLVYSNDQIIDISSKCGFNTLSHFYHQFKKTYGSSPYQYRKAHNLQRSPRPYSKESS